MDSPDIASNDQPVLKATPSEAGAPLEEGILVEGIPMLTKLERGPLSGVTAALMLPLRPMDIESSRKRPPDRVLLSTYVPPQERIHPPMGMVALDSKGAWEIIHRWSPFNQAESPVMHMRDLYPNYFQVLVATHAEKYSIPFPVYMNKEAFQMVAEDRMLIRNHDFH